MKRPALWRALLSRPLSVPAPQLEPVAPAVGEDALLSQLGRALDVRARKLYGRAIGICAVNAGSCNGCEIEITALRNPIYDLARFGLRFVETPRHADVLLVTGPVTHNMRAALESAYAAMPEPKWVMAAGDCAAGCGVFCESYATVGSVEAVLPVDLVIGGCPPRPLELLQGLLTLMAQATAKR